MIKPRCLGEAEEKLKSLEGNMFRVLPLSSNLTFNQ